MFYCGAQQLLEWPAFIQVSVLQLAAADERGQSITMGENRSDEDAVWEAFC